MGQGELDLQVADAQAFAVGEACETPWSTFLKIHSFNDGIAFDERDCRVSANPIQGVGGKCASIAFEVANVKMVGDTFQEAAEGSLLVVLAGQKVAQVAEVEGQGGGLLLEDDDVPVLDEV